MSLADTDPGAPVGALGFAAMDPAVIVPIVSVVVSAVTAVLVPYLTFRHGRQLEAVRFFNAERARLYVDMLAEAHAERTWMELDAHARVHGDDSFKFEHPDTRLGPADRARLGARMVFAEQSVLTAWNRFNGEVARHSLIIRDDDDLMAQRVAVATAFDKLESVTRAAAERAAPPSR
jgi:hypothetical protein